MASTYENADNEAVASTPSGEGYLHPNTESLRNVALATVG